MSYTQHQMVLVYVTCPNLEVAENIATAIVDERLAACANILPGMISIYRWQGDKVRDQEVVLILKTQSSLADAVVNDIVARHPYEVPAVLILPVQGGHDEFISWVNQETAPTE